MKESKYMIPAMKFGQPRTSCRNGNEVTRTRRKIRSEIILERRRQTKLQERADDGK
ncbi:unnamed protein product [Linum tenue]|uniref:Uncharacterized protein n=1 Tax=Linum tenue TaxID=586396 RepID=A0AAV0RZR6_9ROSI|nr:unnamed protein product [Linum tenue]